MALGLLGAVGDIPGMTARDALLPAVTKRDGVDLQQFMGLTQSLDSLTTIIGPALAAFFIGAVGGVPSLWFTAALSFLAALATATIPSAVGAVRATESGMNANKPASQSIVSSTVAALRTGVRVLFRSDKVLSVATLLTLGIVMVMGSFQGLVLPVHFTQNGHPELLGYVLSAMSLGLLISSLGYAALAPRLSHRTWYVMSLFGMLIGIAILGLLPAYPLMLAGALVLGASAGPASALLGFFVLDRIPEESRGSALGTENSLLLAAAPVAVFATSVAVDALGASTAAIALVGCWIVITALALTARGMRHLDDDAESAQPREDGKLDSAQANS